ncbi:hypothetical protein LTR91_006625 [Friedmanniomyces endolithicus]|uniref:Uncharacterized protein n=1 Tax=Friedmanniomyces endolithicus TaxID=329885 RepID=A0A4U0UN39_9PEZI|nr:hypothetical protein LTS09_003787 [Friedmanniomyces endolithicus]KAK0282776.1 hypothetical protein LTR35_006568 [Friedmanniomyces endolithicus]KAK0297170.1 hypothetical protein LTS00_004449 [Friedmanniomyces endolithicus]KAK0315746.1 hypothetical protein LTR01_001046 [Friedmanniomyces endolithicus]KAK0320624.1 hypothetical protein LTR82_008337 [Friedmanniomyces endolithicus]
MPSQLLSLPYDVRYLVYKELFPREEQIYLHAYEKTLKTISPAGTIAANVLLVCRQLHAETGGFLYNGYLFNLVGTKNDCLANYKPFLRTLRKYARDEVNINAFSNGDHSATICLSLQAGDARMGILNRRRRGEPKTLQELQAKQAPAAWVMRVVTVAIVLIALLTYAIMPRL